MYGQRRLGLVQEAVNRHRAGITRSADDNTGQIDIQVGAEQAVAQLQGIGGVGAQADSPVAIIALQVQGAATRGDVRAAEAHFVALQRDVAAVAIYVQAGTVIDIVGTGCRVVYKTLQQHRTAVDGGGPCNHINALRCASGCSTGSTVCGLNTYRIGTV